jgi:predicted CXXCH cytochrome family protein
MGGVGSGFGGASRVPFVSVGASDFDAATALDTTKNAVFCLTCHKAHGSENAFALNWDPQTVPRPKGCDQCHGVMEP